MFRNYLLSDEVQQIAVTEYGLRPMNNNVTMPAITHNLADYDQPTQLFASPSVATVYAVQDVWQSARKDVNMVMLLDVSGSMSGSKMASMRTAAEQFVQQMGDDDYLTVIAFSHELHLVVDRTQVGESRDKIVQVIQSLSAQGDTALYDAIGTGAELIAESTSSQTSNALVVLTDGLDTYSYRFQFDDALIRSASANDTTVFTIAYGGDADEGLLQTLAERGVWELLSGE